MESSSWETWPTLSDLARSSSRNRIGQTSEMNSSFFDFPDR
jgi:hypothetical protein